jgi:hypothetical protein
MAARSGRAVLCSKCAAAALGLAVAVLVAGFVPDRQASDPIAVVGADVDVSRDLAVQSEVSIAAAAASSGTPARETRKRPTASRRCHSGRSDV